MYLSLVYILFFFLNPFLLVSIFRGVRVQVSNFLKYFVLLNRAYNFAYIKKKIDIIVIFFLYFFLLNTFKFSSNFLLSFSFNLFFLFFLFNFILAFFPFFLFFFHMSSS